MRLIWIVLVKELVDGVRDWRSLSSALMYPLTVPLLLLFIMSLDTRSNVDQEPLRIGIQHAEQAPNLVRFLTGNDATVELLTTDPEEAVTSGDYEVVLILGEDHAERFRQGLSTDIAVLHDLSRVSSIKEAGRAVMMLNEYRYQIRQQRLMGHGIAANYALSPIRIHRVDLSKADVGAMVLSEMVVMFILVAAFLCNMYTVIDVTAGERERGSLEPLLVNPVNSAGLILGKFLAVLVFGASGVMLTLASTLTGLWLIPMRGLAFSLDFGIVDMLLFASVALPLTAFAGAFQLLAAAFARSFKEAQIYVSLTLMLSFIPGFWLVVNPSDGETWMMAVPVLSHQILLKDVLQQDAIVPLHLMLSAGTSLAICVVLLGLTAWLFRQERVIFGR